MMKIGEGSQASAQAAGKSPAADGRSKQIDEQIKRLEDEKKELQKSAQEQKGDKKADIEKAIQKIDQQIQELRSQKSQIAKEGEKVEAPNQEKAKVEQKARNNEAAEYIGGKKNNDPLEGKDNTYRMVRDENGQMKAQFNRPLADKQADEDKKDQKEEEQARLGKFARDIDVLA